MSNEQAEANRIQRRINRILANPNRHKNEFTQLMSILVDHYITQAASAGYSHQEIADQINAKIASGEIVLAINQDNHQLCLVPATMVVPTAGSC